MTFHVNPETGESGKCQAKKGGCPFGEHYPTEQEASRAWESGQYSQTTLQGVKKRKLILSDVDGTLTKSSLVLTNAVELHQSGVVDLGDSPKRWLSDMKNEDRIAELAMKYVGALKGRKICFTRAEETIDRMLASDSNFYSTLQELIQHKKEGHNVVLITGSPDFLVEPFAKRFGFEFHASKYHVDKKGAFTGETSLMAGSSAKREVVKNMELHEYDIVVGIGDTASDSPLLEVAHHSVLVDPSDETLETLKENNVRIDRIVRH